MAAAAHFWVGQANLSPAMDGSVVDPLPRRASSGAIVDIGRGRWGVPRDGPRVQRDQHGAVQKPDGGYALWWAGLAEGQGAGSVLQLDPRAQPWDLDLQREAARLGSCERGAVLLWHPEERRWVARPTACGSRLCPVCASIRAGRARAAWLAIHEAAASDGAQIRHYTLTQKADCTPGGLVTHHESERYGWRGTVANGPGTVGRPTGGETLQGAYTRLRRNDRRWRTGRRGAITRARLGGIVRGTEWTGRGHGGVPRWHVHIHALCVTERPISEDDARDELIRFARLGGGSIKAQHCRVVEPRAVFECIKYPFKPSNLTSAQRIETLAYARGLRPHHACGAWHSRDARHAEEPWARWFAARPPPPVWRRLHIKGGDGEWTVYTGSPSEGSARFGILGDDDEDPAQLALVAEPEGRRAQRWRTWEADAAPYAAMLRGVDPTLAPVLEPGSDEDDDDDAADAAAK